MEAAPIMKAVNLAVGLGGWEIDPSDPLKAPYAPEEAARTAAERYGITDPDDLATIRRIVEARRADDARVNRRG
jgi:hypothetical protein